MYNDDYLKKILGENIDSKSVFKNIENEFNYENNIYPREMYKQVHDIVSFNLEDNKEENNKKEYSNLKEVKSEEKDKNRNENKDKNIKQVNNFVTKTRSEFEMFYPEIYKIIVPMIEELVSRNKHMSITQEVIETMVSEIYDYVEEDIISNKDNNTTINNDKEAILVHVNPYRRKPRNMLLFDLIKILLLNRLCII